MVGKVTDDGGDRFPIQAFRNKAFFEWESHASEPLPVRKTYWFIFQSQFHPFRRGQAVGVREFRTGSNIAGHAVVEIGLAKLFVADATVITLTIVFDNRFPISRDDILYLQT